MYEAIITWIHNVGVPLLGWFGLLTIDCWEFSGDPMNEAFEVIYLCEYSVNDAMTEYHNGGFAKKEVVEVELRDGVFIVK